MKQDAMAGIARLMARVMVNAEAPEQVRPDVIAFRQAYQTMSYVR